MEMLVSLLDASRKDCSDTHVQTPLLSTSSEPLPFGQTVIMHLYEDVMGGVLDALTRAQFEDRNPRASLYT